MARERERRHFQAIRKAKEAEHAQRLREALKRHPLERMREGLELAVGPVDATMERVLDRRAAGQAQLAQRARALHMRGELGVPRETA